MQASCSTHDLIKSLGIPEVDQTRRYWIVRSNSGTYYEDFLVNGFVAIGYNQLDETVLREYDGSYQADLALKEQISRIFPQEKRPGIIVSTVRSFLLEMHKGDIILTPSVDSDYISFGQVTSDDIIYETTVHLYNLAYQEQDSEITACEYLKRRKVAWLKTVPRDRIDLKLSRAFFAHHAVANIDKYGAVIDRTLLSFFLKGNELHFKFDIRTNNKISARTHLALLSSCCSLIEEFNEFGDDSILCNFDDIQLKVQAESPGVAEFICDIPEIGAMIGDNLKFLPPVLILGFAYIALFGGEISFAGFKFHPESGLIDKIIGYYERLKKDKTPSLTELENACETLETVSQHPMLSNVIKRKGTNHKKDEH